MKLFNQSLIALSALGIASMAMATDPLANTLWQTYDDGEPKAVVKLTESNGALTGKIISANTDKGQQYVGRTIISGLKAEGGGKYGDGTITDPEKNKSYDLTATLNGDTLKVTGHSGIFWRNQTWKKK